ncbi:hypothetical protein Q8A67_004019 [Cirrhinus molitorella]|uniref:Uncharacterized protein n=1 Tax=Cirrhinus molitorella TaxID=172907 RepID=A0AA88QG86_9TELE|nr:hypothetical protein Q8A67_004019 [Cirrhinus molitorella]
MGTGNSHEYDLTGDLSKEDIFLKALSLPSQTESFINNQSVRTSGSREDENHLDPTNTCPVCFSALKPARIKGTTDKLLQCTRCPTAQLLCGSCLYPCTSAACTNKLCPLVSTLLTCEVVSDPLSTVLGCPTFRACQMKRTRRTRKNGMKNADVNKKNEELRSVRKTVIQWNGRGRTTMGAGNSQVNDLTGDLSQEEILKELSLPSQTQSIMHNQSVNTTSGSQEEGNHLDPTNTCPVCFSALKPACIKGTSDKLLQCTQCPNAQLLCGSCLYPCTSTACTNKLCLLVVTLLTCEVVSDPKSKAIVARFKKTTGN